MSSSPAHRELSSLLSFLHMSPLSQVNTFTKMWMGFVVDLMYSIEKDIYKVKKIREGGVEVMKGEKQGLSWCCSLMISLMKVQISRRSPALS